MLFLKVQLSVIQKLLRIIGTVLTFHFCFFFLFFVLSFRKALQHFLDLLSPDSVVFLVSHTVNASTSLYTCVSQ